MSPPSASPRPRPPLVVRAFTSPVSTGAIERRVRRELGPILAWSWIGAIVLFAAILAWGVNLWWSSRLPMLTPRHRAEALCYVLAQPPVFAPPMSVEPDAALVEGHFPPSTPPALALQSVMHFSDEMIVAQQVRRVGDFDVATMWLRVPETGGSTHWLVVGWMEGSDLAVCSFRFGGRGQRIDADETAWGDALLERVLVPENFRADGLPNVRLRAARQPGLPHFGPPRVN